MPERVRKIGITGASGYIGRALVAHATKDGRQVVALGRRSVSGVSAWRHADLARPPAEDLLDGIDAVIHLAAETGGGLGEGTTAEVAFAEALARAAVARSLPCVFVSSQAAGAAAPSEYGRRKAAIEKALLPFQVTVVRPGMVVGGAPAGLQGQLRTLVASLPVLPRLLPAPMVQPVHVDDLAEALLRCVDGVYGRGQTISVAGPPIPFHVLLEGFARHDSRRLVFWIPLPVSLIRWILKWGSFVFGSRFSVERLDSLLALPSLEAPQGLKLRPLEDALDRRGQPVREWLREGDALARALLGHAAPPVALRRYVALIRRRSHSRPLHLPLALLNCPQLIAALDVPARRRMANPLSLIWRLNLMSRVLEATPQLVDSFIVMPDRAGRVRLFFSLVGAVIDEVMARVCRPLAKLLLARTSERA